MKALTVWQPQAYLAGVLHGDGWCTWQARNWAKAVKARWGEA